MKILVAGSTGAIGQPLLDNLIRFGYDVFGITHSDERAQDIAAKGAKPVIVNVLDQSAVHSSLEDIRPDVVIDMLTSLPKEYTPETMQITATDDAELRWKGGQNLLQAAEACGSKRYVVQSSCFWYEPGKELANETCSFAFNATPGIAEGSRLYFEIEKRVLQSKKIEGVALRFGFFYGPKTWFYSNGSVANQIKKQQFPIIAQGQGVWNFIHIEDAAKAILEAIYCTPGAYNIVNDRPTAMKEWLPAFARYLGAPKPPILAEDEGIKLKGTDFVYYCTKLRGASNAKAKAEFNFVPRTFEWLL